MRAHAGLVFIIGAMLGLANGLPALSAAQAGGSSGTLASGTTLNAELSASVDSKKAKAGDSVRAQITEVVKEDGKTVIPKGAKLVGRVTQASARAKGDPESSLAIQFEKVVLKNGQELPLNVWIKAIAAEPRSSYEPGPEQNTMAGTPGAGQSPMGSGRSTMGGPPAATTPPVGTSTDTVGGPGGSTNSAERTVGSAGGLNAAGQLSSNSRGVFGLDGVHLATDAANAARGSLITSLGKNVQLGSGTRLLLVVTAEVDATPSK